MANHQLLVLAVSLPFFVLASIFVGLYLIASAFVLRKLELHDYLMLLAWVSVIFSIANRGVNFYAGN